MYLAGLMLQEGHDVRVFDGNTDDAIEANIAAFAPDLLGITCVTSVINGAGALASRLKSRLRSLVVVVGGPHPTVLPTETLERHPAIDYCFIGESEQTFVRFTRWLFGSASDRVQEGTTDGPASMQGLAYREHGVPVMTPLSGWLEQDALDALPLPPWHLLPLQKIFQNAEHGLFSRGTRILPVMTTRGCPNYCTFCCRVMGFNFRARSIPNVMAEIEWLVKDFAVDEIYFEDDTFTQDKDRAHILLDEIIRLRAPIHIKFANGLRADKVDRDLLQRMKEAGVYWVGFGIESGARHTQELMVKNLDLDLAAKNVRLAQEMGFKVGSNCIIGYPGERLSDIAESIDYFLKLDLDSFAVVPCIPFPGTTAWQVADREGWLTDRAKDYDNYFFEIFKVNPLIETPHLSSREMARAIRDVYVRFYFLNPKRARNMARFLARQVARRAARVPPMMRLLRSNTVSSRFRGSVLR